MRWDDLKYLLAVAEHGTLAPAARALGVDGSTVSRRIAALEEDLSTELVARTPEGMVLTDAGRIAADVAGTIDRELATLGERIAGGRDEASGQVRISATESFSAHVMSAMAPLHERFPALAIEVLASSAPVDLRRREADVALRFFREERDGLAMRKLGHVGWTLYASPAYLARHPAGPALLDGHDVIGYSDELKATNAARWLAEHASPDTVRMRCSNTRIALDAALAGVGVALLASFMAVDQPLVRLTDQVLVSNEAWAVFLPERRSETRIRLVVDALVDLFSASGSTFDG
jgi:DNA-binding transcriptional LysR family regulator